MISFCGRFSCIAFAPAVGLAPVGPSVDAASASGGSAPVSVSFASPGSFSFTVPAGVDVIEAQAYGAQGGGNRDGEPGGLGALAVQTALAVTPGETLTVDVG